MKTESFPNKVISDFSISDEKMTNNGFSNFRDITRDSVYNILVVCRNSFQLPRDDKTIMSVRKSRQAETYRQTQRRKGRDLLSYYYKTSRVAG